MRNVGWRLRVDRLVILFWIMSTIGKCCVSLSGENHRQKTGVTCPEVLTARRGSLPDWVRIPDDPFVKITIKITGLRPNPVPNVGNSGPQLRWILLLCGFSFLAVHVMATG